MGKPLDFLLEGKTSDSNINYYSFWAGVFPEINEIYCGVSPKYPETFPQCLCVYIRDSRLVSPWFHCCTRLSSVLRSELQTWTLPDSVGNKCCTNPCCVDLSDSRDKQHVVWHVCQTVNFVLLSDATHISELLLLLNAIILNSVLSYSPSLLWGLSDQKLHPHPIGKNNISTFMYKPAASNML